MEMGTVFGTYEMSKRALMLLSSGGRHPVEVVSVDELPARPPTEGLLEDMPRGTGAAVHEVGEAGPHEARGPIVGAVARVATRISCGSPQIFARRAIIA